METATLLRTADRNLRRIYAGNIAGLTTFANALATSTQTSPVTITSGSMEGGAGAGQVTMPREVWLAAAEDLLADPYFNPAASAAARPPRQLIPDYSGATSW